MTDFTEDALANMLTELNDHRRKKSVAITGLTPAELLALHHLIDGGTIEECDLDDAAVEVLDAKLLNAFAAHYAPDTAKK
jgi:hypothetical protein